MKHVFIIFSLGALSSFAMAPTNIWFTLFIGLSGLYILLCKADSPIKASFLGFFFSLGYFGFSLSWIGNALLVEGNPYWWAWPFAVSGLPAFLSLFTALGCYGYKLLCKNRNDIASYITFATFIFISEYARGHLFTGFPWNLYGYTWIDLLPIAQLASLSNIYILTMITILWASAPGFLLTTHYSSKIKLFILSFIILSFGGSYLFGVNRIENNPTKYHDEYETIIVQANIKQSEKWKSEKREPNFVKQIKLSKYNPLKNSPNKAAYYIIWPETAISQDLINTSWARNKIGEMLRSYPSEAYLVTGALRHNSKSQAYFNSIITFNSNTEIIHTYDKSHLVPFGEYMPFKNILDIAPIVGFTGFKEGDGQKTFHFPEGIKFSPLICYEIIFPSKTLNYSSPRPNIIINVTNDAWYGHSAGPYQHLVQSQFRAIETGTPVLRSANTGISAMITPIGHKIGNAKLMEQTTIIGGLPIPLETSMPNYYIQNIVIILLFTCMFIVNTRKFPSFLIRNVDNN